MLPKEVLWYHSPQWGAEGPQSPPPCYYCSWSCDPFTFQIIFLPLVKVWLQTDSVIFVWCLLGYNRLKFDMFISEATLFSAIKLIDQFQVIFVCEKCSINFVICCSHRNCQQAQYFVYENLSWPDILLCCFCCRREGIEHFSHISKKEFSNVLSSLFLWLWHTQK